MNDAPERKLVEIDVRDRVRAAARHRVNLQNSTSLTRVSLAAIARAVVEAAAEQVSPGAARTIPVPERVIPGTRRKPLRITVFADRWERDRDRLRSAGRSVTRVVEDGLQHYAETGRVELPPWWNTAPTSFDVDAPDGTYRATYDPEQDYYRVIAPDGRDLDTHPDRAEAHHRILRDASALVLSTATPTATTPESE